MGGIGSGVPSTPEDRLGKVEAGRASAVAREAKKERAPFVVVDMPQDRPASLADYDKILGQPVSWTDAKKREEVQGEIILNETRADERAVARKKLFTKAQVEARDRRFEEAVLTSIAALSDFAASLVESEKKDDARGRAKDWIKDFRKQLAEAMK